MMAPPPPTPPPHTDAVLEPWHFADAECSVVIYYSFPVREAKTELQKKKKPAPVSGVRTERHLWLKLLLRAVCPWQIYLLGLLPSILSKAGAVNSLSCEHKGDNAGKGTGHSAY